MINDQKISRTDMMCLRAVERGLIIVDTSLGYAWSKRFGSKQLGCLNTKGYIVFTLHLDGERAQIKMHRLIWLAKFGLIPNNLMPDHNNRIRSDNRIENLSLVTSQGNSLNRCSYKNEGNPCAKINFAIANQIRVRHLQVRSLAMVAKEFCVSKSLVAQIVRRQLWK